MALIGFARIHEYWPAVAGRGFMGVLSAFIVIPIEARLQNDVDDARRGTALCLAQSLHDDEFSLGLAVNLNGGLLAKVGPAGLIEYIGITAIVHRGGAGAGECLDAQLFLVSSSTEVAVSSDRVDRLGQVAADLGLIVGRLLVLLGRRGVHFLLELFLGLLELTAGSCPSRGRALEFVRAEQHNDGQKDPEPLRPRAASQMRRLDA